jgi:predicted transcriptional regulator
MALLIRRSKVVSIRVSDDEFRRLKEMCMDTGARCVSDLARDAMFKLIRSGDARQGSEDAELQTRVRELDEKLSALQGRVSRLAMLVLEGER